jgi:hypothetical protein
MATRKPNMTEMSKPAEILYRAFFDELRGTKQQQWTVTNYALLLMGWGRQARLRFAKYQREDDLELARGGTRGRRSLDAP